MSRSIKTDAQRRLAAKTKRNPKTSFTVVEDGVEIERPMHHGTPNLAEKYWDLPEETRGDNGKRT